MDKTNSSIFWFLKGASNLASIPALILMSAFVGFAGFAKESGVEMVYAVTMTALIWALPAKVILIAAITSGTGIFAAAFAVALSSVRLMPMVSTLVPEIRTAETRTITLLILSRFIAVTAYVIAMQKVRDVPRQFRTAWFGGVGLTLTSVNLLIVFLVYQFSAALPGAILGALFFLTPVYFLTSLWATARDHVVKIAMVCGLVLGPVCHVFMPEIDLLVAGIVGGTAAYFIGKTNRFSGASS